MVMYTHSIYLRRKNKYSDSLYYIAKLLQNGLYGRFGLNPENNIVEIVTPEKAMCIFAFENLHKIFAKITHL